MTTRTHDAPRAWQRLHTPTAAEVASQFGDPPPEVGPVLWWGWTGAMTAEVITRDLDDICALGFRAVMIEAGYGMSPRYLSDEWFAAVRLAVGMARERGLRVILVDEGKYPSGFAGGKFTRERPDLRMQGLAVAAKIPVAPGETLCRPVSADTVGALALNVVNEEYLTLQPSGGAVQWTAPAEGEWQVWLVDHAFRTAVTRDVHNPTQEKDASSSLYDYLNPEGTQQFLAWVHERYAATLGEELGSTVIGIRGDEPDYAHIPWTPRILDEFVRRKGYDVRPHLPALFAPHPTEKDRRARADYWDVWSALFAESFFRPLAQWCEAHGAEYLVHLNHEDIMPWLVRSEGSFFRALRDVSLPGVDAIWNQIWPDRVADFPLLASSAAHLNGRPRAFSESFAAYRTRPNLAEAKWVLDHQLARGINLFEFMFYPSSASAPERHGFMAEDAFPALAEYVRRACCLLSQGVPTAEIAVYYPTMGLWLGSDADDAAAWEVAAGLLARQYAFDLVDDDALAGRLTLRGGALWNASGQGYRAVLVPPTAAISRAALARLRALAAQGGQVIFLGAAPALVAGHTFRDAVGPADVSWALHEPAGTLTPTVLGALPQRAVTVDVPCPSLRAVHRRWADADVYLLFQEGEQPLSARVRLRGRGPARRWDAASGEVSAAADAAQDGEHIILPLALAPWEARIIVVGG